MDKPIKIKSKGIITNFNISNELYRMVDPEMLVLHESIIRERAFYSGHSLKEETRGHIDRIINENL